MLKEISILVHTFLFFSAGLLAQGLINNGAVINIDNGANIYIDGGTNGDFTNQDAAGPSYGTIAIISSDGAIQLEGDWTNTSADPANKVFSNILNGTVEFLGTTAQSIGGTSSTNFPTLLINNSSGLATGVTLNIPAIVNQSLTLTDGVINTTTANYVRLQSLAATTIGSASSYIDGPIQYAMATNGTTTLNLPLGKGNDWRPVELTPTHSGFGTYVYTAELFNADAQGLGFTLPGSFTHVSYAHYYTITRSSAIDFTNATIKIYYSNINGAPDGVTDAANLGVAKDDGSGNWVDITSGGGSANNIGNILSASYTPQDTYFALANKTGGTNPLPIELLDFSGKCNEEGTTHLQWTTGTEINNAFFTLDKSFNGIDYTTIATIPGAGTSSSPKYYSYTDISNSVATGAYYRLTQTDFDGTKKTFDPIYINCSNDHYSSFTVFPNPSSGNFNVLISGIKDKNIQAVIYDVLGREIYSTGFAISNNENMYQINFPTSPAPGTYTLRIKYDQEIFNQKIVIQ